MSEHVDPAVLDAERRRQIQSDLSEAEKAEKDALMYWQEDAEVAEQFALARANNYRLHALCDHFNLRVRDGD